MTKRASAMSHNSSKTEVLVSKSIILNVGIVIFATFWVFCVVWLYEVVFALKYSVVVISV